MMIDVLWPTLEFHRILEVLVLLFKLCIVEVVRINLQLLPISWMLQDAILLKYFLKQLLFHLLLLLLCVEHALTVERLPFLPLRSPPLPPSISLEHVFSERFGVEI